MIKAEFNKTDTKRTIQRIHKTKSCFFEKNCYLWKDKQNWKALSQTNQKEGNPKVNKIRDEKGCIRISTTEIQKVLSLGTRIPIPQEIWARKDKWEYQI
jgi:hypothetical protein